MTERAQKIVDATMELTLRPQQGDRAKVIAAALREVVKELKYIGITEKNILELADELEAL
jgi:DNA-binding transcriptional regulator YhcF (GntR family)